MPPPMVNDAHVHFFSTGFFAALARQRRATPAAVPADLLQELGWDDDSDDGIRFEGQLVEVVGAVVAPAPEEFTILPVRTSSPVQMISMRMAPP